MPSSVIARFSYNQTLSELKITFVSGTIYYYEQVPPEIYKKMKVAESKGQYFNQFIKGKFDFRK